MKTTIFVLAMLLTAATAYNQTSRKPANNNTATNTKERTVPATRSNTPRDSQRDNTHANIPRSATTTTPTTRTEQTAAHRPVSRENTANREHNNQPPIQNPDRENRNQTPVQNPDRENRNQPPIQNPDRESRNKPYTAIPRPEPDYRPHIARPHVIEYNSPRVYRENHRAVHYYNTPPASREYRSVNYVYRRPARLEVFWTPEIHRHFMEIYPMVEYWDYYNGYRIEMISAYDALNYRGDVMTVYGQVSEVFYTGESDEYFLYFGACYPYQDFTVILPGYLARNYSRRPERFFDNQYMAVTGLITTFNNEPEIVVKESFQINLY